MAQFLAVDDVLGAVFVFKDEVAELGLGGEMLHQAAGRRGKDAVAVKVNQIIKPPMSVEPLLQFIEGRRA